MVKVPVEMDRERSDNRKLPENTVTVSFSIRSGAASLAIGALVVTFEIA